MTIPSPQRSPTDDNEPGPQPGHHDPVRDDGVTMGVCAGCGRAFPKHGRGQYCGGACRQGAWRRRKQAEAAAAPAVSSSQLPIIYECTVCETRYLGERRCPECNLYNRRVGLGGPCPHCDELVAFSDLTGQR